MIERGLVSGFGLGSDSGFAIGLQGRIWGSLRRLSLGKWSDRDNAPLVHDGGVLLRDQGRACRVQAKAGSRVSLRVAEMPGTWLGGGQGIEF